MSSQAMTRRNFLGTSAAATAALAQSDAPNETIEHARKVALDMLKPSQRDLDHGFELHANSIVFDAYAAGPQAAIDGDAMRKAMDAGASEIELQDMHEDMFMTRAAVDPAGARRVPPSLEGFRRHLRLPGLR